MKRIYILTSFFLITFFSNAQIPDSTAGIRDSVGQHIVKNYDSKISTIIYTNAYLNAESNPISMKNSLRKKPVLQDMYFLIISFLLFVLAFLKFGYSKYFENLFRVFFNTSLKQGQLTDQLLQAKLPSMFFNIFFTFTGGLYVYFILLHYGFLNNDRAAYYIILLTTCTAIVYFSKFIILKFTGWIVHAREVTDNYIFIVFLINKILGIFLLPIIIVMAFAKPWLVSLIASASIVIIILLLVLRFFRSYGILQNRLKFSNFHFIIYFVGIEILPLLLIYKSLMIFLGKNV